MHIQRKISDLDCLWESASHSLLNLEYEKDKNVKAVGNQNSSETHVIKMIFDQKTTEQLLHTQALVLYCLLSFKTYI